MQVRVKLRGAPGMVMGSECMQILNGEPLEEVDCFKYLGRNWQPMEDVKGMWYTE